MSDYLKELFNLTEANMEDPPRVRELNHALEEYRARVEAVMGQEFAKNAARLEFERYRLESFLSFQRGFHTAVSLIAPAPPTPPAPACSAPHFCSASPHKMSHFAGAPVDFNPRGK